MKAVVDKVRSASQSSAGHDASSRVWKHLKVPAGSAQRGGAGAGGWRVRVSWTGGGRVRGPGH